MNISKITCNQDFGARYEKQRGMECCPKPRRINAPSYGQLLVECAIKDMALKEASRIIAQDMYMRSNK